MAGEERVVPEGFVTITEGKAVVLNRKGEVFFNKAQVQVAQSRMLECDMGDRLPVM